MKQEARRGWRTITYAVSIFSLLAILALLAAIGTPGVRLTIAGGALIVVGIGQFGYVAENIAQRLSFAITRDGVTGSIGGNGEGV